MKDSGWGFRTNGVKKVVKYGVKTDVKKGVRKRAGW
jgi:hypothetical protein